jgi:hypothetical protein
LTRSFQFPQDLNHPLVSLGVFDGDAYGAVTELRTHCQGIAQEQAAFGSARSEFPHPGRYWEDDTAQSW